VEGDHQLREPVVLVQFVDDLVDHVFLDFDFSQLVHGFEEDAGRQVALLVEVAVVLLSLDFGADVAQVLLQFLVFLVQLGDFLVGVLHHLVLDLEVVDGLAHVFEVF